MTNEALHLETKKSAMLEKACAVIVLKNLEKIYQRKMFIDYGYSTLSKYMQGELGYSEGESWTRIQAMKLISDSPVAEELMTQGELSLSNASTLNEHLKDSHTRDPRERELIIRKGAKTPNRKLKRELNPNPILKKIILNERILKKMAKLLEDQSELELIESLLDEKLKQIEISKNSRTSEKPSDIKTRYIPMNTKREVYERSGHQCEHKHLDGTRCKEKRNLQYDHVEPHSLGGGRTVNNIRMLCSGHNQRRALDTFGKTRTS